MSSILISNSLLRTIEYKLHGLEHLKTTSFSMSGIKTESFKLHELNYRDKSGAFSYFSWTSIIIGLLSIALCTYFSSITSLIDTHFFSVVMLIALISMTFFFALKTEDGYIYFKEKSTNILIKLRKSNNSTDDSAAFLKKLNLAIDQSKSIQSDENIEDEQDNTNYDKHSKNIDALLNHGIIDEKLYRRLNQRIDLHESIFNKKISSENEFNSHDNVIYLHPK